MSNKWKIHRPLLLLKRGDISFATFYELTKSDWRAMAAKQHVRMKHRLGGVIDFDDILQEMLMSIPKSVEAYNAERGSMTIGSFVVWNAFAASKDRINQQCGAYKGRTMSKSRAPVCASQLVRETEDGDADGDARLEEMIASEAEQDWAAMVRERRSAICETLLDHVIMDHLVERGASLNAIAEALFENVTLREQFGLANKKVAYGTVRRVTDRFVERAATL